MKRPFFLCALAVVVAGLVLHAWFVSGTLGVSCMDGIMQSFNPLRRLAAGQTMGREFDLFHGPGTLGLQYFVWCLCGKGLRAVIFERELLAPMLFLLSFVLFAQAVRFPWPTALLLVLSGLKFYGHLMLSLEMLPGNSLLSLRIFMPVSAFFCAILLSRRLRLDASPLAFAALAGAAEGLAFFFSFEQGLAGAAAGAVVLAWWPEVSRPGLRRRLAALGVYAAALIVTAALLYLAACGGAAGHVVDFFLHDIPLDQFWYFGAPPNTGLGNVLLSSLHKNTSLTLLLFAGGLGLLLDFRRRGWLRGAPPWATGSLFYLGVYAVICQVPTLAFPSHYWTTMVRVAMMVWLYLGARLWEERERFSAPVWQRLVQLASRLSAWRCACLAALGLAAGAEIVCPVLSHWRHAGSPYEADSRGTFDGVSLSDAWQQEVNFCAEVESSRPRFASTYSGLIEARLGIFNPASDYIIHALGRKRDRYVPTLRAYDPDYFATINPGYSIYESWLEVSHWDLYRWLLQDYEVNRITPTRVFWKKAAHAGPPPPERPFLPLTCAADHFEIAPPADADLHLYEVRVRYRIENPFGRLPLLGKVPRYLLTRENLRGEARVDPVLYGVSLPPQLRAWVFPVLVRGGEVSGLKSVVTQNFGLPVRCVLESAEARAVDFPAGCRPALGLPW